MAYTNSPLVTYTRLTQDRTSRKGKIDTITIHCYVGQVTAKQGCDYFATTDRQVSSNYVVGKDGSIGLAVEEKDRAWTTGGGRDKNGNEIRVNGISGADNDHRSVTIEVACNSKAPYAITDDAYQALIGLVADICKRNGIKKLLWEGDKNLVGQIDRQNMTVHRWFAATECPGEYLFERMGDIANAANKLLGVSVQTDSSTKNPTKQEAVPSIVYPAGAKVTLKSVPLYTSSTAKDPASKKSGTFYLWSGEMVNGRIRVTNRKASVGVAGQVTGWINTADVTLADMVEFKPYTVRVTTSVLNIRSGASLTAPVVGHIRDRGVYTIVREATESNVRWGKLKSGAGWISLNYTEKV